MTGVDNSLGLLFFFVSLDDANFSAISGALSGTSHRCDTESNGTYRENKSGLTL